MPREFTRPSQGTVVTPGNPEFYNVETLQGQTTEGFVVDGTGRYRITVGPYTGNGFLALLNSSGATIATLSPGAWQGTLAADTYRIAVASGSPKGVSIVVERTN